MAQIEKTYKTERTCSKCGHHEEIVMSKRDAAFELVDIDEVLGNVCKKCSSTSFTSTYQHPDLDFDLLKEWATNPDLYLMHQDEELMLANEKYLNDILQIFDTIHLSDDKRNVLMEALCIIVYDNSNERNSRRDTKLRDKVVGELNNRRKELMLADDSIMNYIKEVVYPQLSL